MSDYKRLTERSGNGIAIKDTSTNDNKSIWNAIERLAELEDMIDDGRLWFTPSNGLRPNPYECAKRWEELWYEIRVQYNDLKNKIENGTLIELPCNVGDKVYMPWEYDGISDVATLTIKRLSVDDKCITTDLTSDNSDFYKKYGFGVFMFDEIGTKVFLTKPEAKAKLRK